MNDILTASETRDKSAGNRPHLVLVLGMGPLCINGQVLSESGEPLWLIERTVIELPGQLRLVVTPGRTGASKLRQQLDEQREQLMRQLKVSPPSIPTDRQNSVAPFLRS